MKLTSLYMRLHGASNFTEVTTDGVGVVSKIIGSPMPKINAVSADGMNGIIDFTDAMGVYYNNRTISVTIQATNMEDITGLTSPSLDNFVRNYHGKVVDLSFEDNVTHYYTGRLSVTADDHKDRYRTITFAVDADPFRYAISPTIVNIPIAANNNKVTAASLTTTNASANWVTGYSRRTLNVHSSNVSIVTSNEWKVSFPVSGLTANSEYVINYSATSGVEVKLYTSSSLTTEIAINDGVFTATGASVYVCFVGTIRSATISNITVMQNPTRVTLHNGDKITCPSYETLAQDVTIVKNGEQIVLPKDSSWTPYFGLLAGETEIYAVADAAGVLTVTYTKAVF